MKPGSPRQGRLRAEVSGEQIDEFITLAFHGGGSLSRAPPLTVPPQRPTLIVRTPKLRPACITNTDPPPPSPCGRHKEAKQGRKTVTPPHRHCSRPLPDWQATLVKAPSFLILVCFYKFSSQVTATAHKEQEVQPPPTGLHL